MTELLNIKNLKKQFQLLNMRIWMNFTYLHRLKEWYGRQLLYLKNWKKY